MIYQTSVPGLLRTIIIIIAVYYGVKYLIKFFAPHLMRYAARKMEEKVKEQFQQNQTYQQKSKSPIQNKKDKKEVGEYIDYEEID